jgi:LPS-assembly protein
VVLPGGAPSDKGLSDLMLGAGITWDPHWAFDSVVQYNRETNRSTRTTVQARYSPGPFRTLSAAYRLQRDLANESVDVGWQWPWAAARAGAANWAPRARAAAAAAGAGTASGAELQHERPPPDRGAAGLRIRCGLLDRPRGAGEGQQLADLVDQAHHVPAGAGRPLASGIEPLRSLRNSIPHYQLLRQETTSPSRFTDYE